MGDCRLRPGLPNRSDSRLPAELGHAIGISHIGPGNLMAPTYSSTINKPQSGDIQEAIARYGPPRVQPSEPDPTDDETMVLISIPEAMGQVAVTPHDQLIYEIRQLRMQMRAMMMLICILIVVVVGQAFAGDADTALADRSSIPQSEWPYIYHFGTETADAEQREPLAKVLAFTICSLNDEVVIEHQLPRNVNGVYRIDTRQLGWESLPALLRDHYPYTLSAGNYLSLSAPIGLSSSRWIKKGGDAYFRLLFGRTHRERWTSSCRCSRRKRQQVRTRSHRGSVGRCKIRVHG